MKNSFDKILRGLKILAPYNPACLTCEPVANSFPNGAPDHSHRAYINIEVGPQIWNLGDSERKELLGLGFQPEQEDQYWIHFGG